MKNIDSILDEIEQKLHAVEKMSFKGFQPVSVFTDWEVGETRNLTGTISTMVYKAKNHFCFFVIIPAGEKMDIQWHDWIECCYVVQGLLGDQLNPGQKTKMGEVLRFKVGEKHMPKNLLPLPLKLFVHFSNPLLR